MTDKIRPFSLSIVRLVPTPRSDGIDDLPVPGDRVEVYWPDDLQNITDKNASLICVKVSVKNTDDPRFGQAKEDEIDKLVRMGTYKIVPESNIEADGAVLRSRLVLTIKNSGEESEYFKARLVILGHLDPDKPRVVNEAPTVNKSSIRTVLTLIASFGFNLFPRDISLAFLQSKDELKRNVYVRPPKGSNVLQTIGAPPVLY